MHETVKIWLEELYKNKIEEVKEVIEYEQLWELGYDEEEPINFHTGNIEVLKEYLEVLEEKLVELNK